MPILAPAGELFSKILVTEKVLHNSLPSRGKKAAKVCETVRNVVKLSKSPLEHQGAFPFKYSVPHMMVSNCFLNDLGVSASLNLPARPFHILCMKKGLPNLASKCVS